VTRVTAVVQARMGSTRLPGKVLRRLGTITVLAHVIGRLRRAATLDQIVVATTTSPSDQAVVREALRLGVPATRGAEEDVLSRFVQAFDERGGEVGVRVTSDCPLIDPALVDEAVRKFLGATPPLDYLSNTVERSYPRGYDVEVFRVDALRRAHRDASDRPDREHVTRYLYMHPGTFRIGAMRRGDPNRTASWRLTLDTPEDWAVLEQLVRALAANGAGPDLGAVEAYLMAHPQLLARNAHLAQKAL
jgi:spore coat polysaccharide biosynthesis protein SpsF